MEKSQTVRIACSDDTTVVEVPTDDALLSVTLRNMMEDFGGAAHQGVIPLHNVARADFLTVLDYLKLKRANAEADAAAAEKAGGEAKKSPTQVALRAWELRFVEEFPDEKLFLLIMAANYLDIKPLLDVLTKRVASFLHDKTPEQIRVRFNIKNDFTPEEEAKVMRENEWCEDASVKD